MHFLIERTFAALLIRVALVVFSSSFVTLLQSHQGFALTEWTKKELITHMLSALNIYITMIVGVFDNKIIKFT